MYKNDKKDRFRYAYCHGRTDTKPGDRREAFLKRVGEAP
jgi:hypothetical protein